MVIDRVEADYGVGSLRLLADLYHLAVNGDDVEPAIDSYAARIGHVQIADAPGRGEPGTGTLTSRLSEPARRARVPRLCRARIQVDPTGHVRLVAPRTARVARWPLRHTHHPDGIEENREHYRKVVPIEKELRVDSRVDRAEGRKIFVTGRLLDGESVLCDAEALFVKLNPGQP